MDSKLKEAVQQLVEDLAAKRYTELVCDGRCGRLTALEIRSAIERYGRTLTPLPEDAWHLVDVLERTDLSDGFALDVPLWTAEEGRSDLTLSLTAARCGPEFRLEIDDVHVL